MRGSTLLIVFWAVAVMSICVLGLVEYLYSDFDETTALKKESRTRQLAESGLAVALNPMVTRIDPLLRQTIAPGESFDVRLRSEGGRLNINTVIQNGRWITLQNLFEEWGMEATDIANLMVGFRNRVVFVSDTSGSQPAEGQPPEGQQPSGAAVLFQSVDDMLIVPGMDAVTRAKPNWRDYFTIWSDGPLDLNDAPADLIAAVTGIGMVRAQQFVSARNGPDGLPDTDDDLIFTNLDQARSLLGMSPEEFAQYQGILSVQDSTSRIESTGALGKFQRKITVVVRRNASPPIFLLWQE